MASGDRHVLAVVADDCDYVVFVIRQVDNVRDDVV